jgi:hypothetical protein
VNPPVSALRIYEPLGAFGEAERARWEAYSASGAAVPRAHGLRLERSAALVALLDPRRAPSPDAGSGAAHVCRVDGITLVCPLRTALRSWEALAEFRAAMPDEVADAFVPRAVADLASDELEQWRRTYPDRRAHVQTATWQVPIRWFVLFSPQERHLVLGRRNRDEERSLTYRAPMAQARRRVARAVAVLRRTLDAAPVLRAVEDLGRWLEEFHPRSLVELDYGGLVDLLSDADLRADESARDVAEALDRLSDRDPDGAGAAYERLTSRWRALAARENAN